MVNCVIRRRLDGREVNKMSFRDSSLSLGRVLSPSVSIAWLAILIWGWFERPDLYYRMFGMSWTLHASLLLVPTPLPAILVIGLAKPRSGFWWLFALGIGVSGLGLAGILVGSVLYPGGLGLIFGPVCLLGFPFLVIVTVAWLLIRTPAWLTARGSRFPFWLAVFGISWGGLYAVTTLYPIGSGIFFGPVGAPVLRLLAMITATWLLIRITTWLDMRERRFPFGLAVWGAALGGLLLGSIYFPGRLDWMFWPVDVKAFRLFLIVAGAWLSVRAIGRLKAKRSNLSQSLPK